jgi:drug/metabolite transporter (DMT)-like permease
MTRPTSISGIYCVTVQKNIMWGILCGAGAGALWGLVFLTPEMARSFGPLELTIGRYVFYGLIAAALIAPRASTLLPLLGKKEWIGLVGLALTGNIFYYLFIVNAVQMGGIAMTSLIVGLVPVAVSIVGSRESGAVPLGRLIPSILLCTASAIAIGWDAFDALFSAKNLTPLIGMICAMGGLVSWTIYAIHNRKWLAQMHAISSYDWNLLLGLVTGTLSLALIPFMIALVDLHHSFSEWLGFIMASALIALLASVAGNALWNQSTRLLPFTMVGQMVLFETLFALLYAFAWENRGPTINEALAFIFVVGSVITCISAHRKPAARVPVLTS